MNKYETRRLALQQLVTSLGRGGITRVAQEIGKEPNYVSRMLYPPGKPGRKRIGEDSADVLNEKFPDWLHQIVDERDVREQRKVPISRLKERSTPWPFHDVDLARLLALPLDDQKEIETDLRHALERVERRLMRTRSGTNRALRQQPPVETRDFAGSPSRSTKKKEPS